MIYPNALSYSISFYQLILALYLFIINIFQQMSDDDDRGMEPQPKTDTVVDAPAAETARGRSSRGGASKTEPASQKEQPKQPVAQEDDGDWISEENDKVNVDAIPDKQANGRSMSRGDKDKEKDNIINNVRVQDNVSEVINPNSTELQVSNNEGCSWLIEGSEKKQEPENQERSNRPRGNRGSNTYNASGNDNEDDGSRRANRGNRNGDNYNRHNQQGNDQRPRRDFNNDREYNNNRGGFGRGSRGPPGEGGDFRKNREEGGEFRGNRGNGGEFKRNRQGGGFNRGYNNRDRDFQGGNHSDRQDHRFNRNNREQQNENGTAQQKPTTLEKVVTIPGGRIWPSCQLYIMGKKLCVTLRKVQDFHSKLLIVPYRNLKLDYYPGNFVISSIIDYKSKIKGKGAELEKPGRVYFQKAVGLANYQAVAFLKVDDSDEMKVKSSIQQGVETILRDLVKIKQGYDTVVFPVSEELCEPAVVIRTFSNFLEEYQSVKEVSLSTKDPNFFSRCIQDYSKCLKEMVENNQLSFQ